MTGLSSLLLVLLAATTTAQEEIVVGSFRTLQHQVAGQVVLVNDRVLEIRDFTYDGQGPDAFVWLDQGTRASRDGKILYDADNCGERVLGRFSGQTLRVELPETSGTTLADYAGGGKYVYIEHLQASLTPILHCTYSPFDMVSTIRSQLWRHHVAGQSGHLASRH